MFFTEFKGWKAIIFIIGILVFFCCTYYSYSLQYVNVWISNLLLSVGVTFFFGVVLSVVFGYITEQTARKIEMKREIHDLRALIIDAKSKITAIKLSRVLNNREKAFACVDAIAILPRLYEIQVYYPKFANMYYSAQEAITKISLEIKNNEANVNYEECLKMLQKLFEESAVLYRLYLQEYGFAKKEPIPHPSIKDIQDSGTEYSQRRRKFK